MKPKIHIVTLFLFILYGQAAGQLRIAVSRSAVHYENWLRQADSTVMPVNLYDMGIDSALKTLSSCSGLLLTGGEDVYPGYYDKTGEIGRCEDINRYRDSLEFALIARAISLNMPVFGICRGEQILNVALGGTLYVDIPTDVGTSVLHRCPPGSANCLHTINIDHASQLFLITGMTTGTVNSYHHQGIDMPAPGFRASALSDNNTVEALERINTGDSPFIMGVQWHPERMADDRFLSGALGRFFVEEAGKYSKE